MPTSILRGSLLVSLLIGSALPAPAWANPTCDVPGPEDTLGLLEAAQQDEMLAGALEAVAEACAEGEGAQACAPARARCNRLLSFVAGKGAQHDESSFRTQLTGTYLGRRFHPPRPLGPMPGHGAISCIASGSALRSVAQQRRQMAQSHQAVAGAHGAWARWLLEQQDACKARHAAAERARFEQEERSQREADAIAASEVERARKQKEAEAAAERKAKQEQEAQAQLAAQARLQARQEQEARARRAAEVEERQAREALLAEQARKAAEAQKLEEQRLEAERRRLEEERQRLETAQQRAAREQAEAAQREKEEAERRAAEQARVEAEQAEQQRRQAEAQAREAAQARQALEEERDRQKQRHAYQSLQEQEEQRREAVLQKTREREAAEEALRKSALESAAAERTRRAEAERQLAAARRRAHPGLRPSGSIYLAGLGSGFAFEGPGGLTEAPVSAGGRMGVRHAFWLEPTGEELASGFELGLEGGYQLRVYGPGEVGLASLAARGRWWIGPVAIGGTAEFRRMLYTSPGAAGSGEARGFLAGPVLSFAAADGDLFRFIVGGRWLPLLDGQRDLVVGELELGYGPLYLAAELGTVRGAPGTLAGAAFSSVFLGFQLRW